MTKDLYLIAHRGEYLAVKTSGDEQESFYNAPEGSRPAYERVRDREINAVKLDVQHTADNVIVMSHDTNLKRTTGDDLVIGETDWERLRKCTFLPEGGYRDERILTFDEALEIVKDTPLFYLDFKNYSEGMLREVVAKLGEYGISTDRVMVATFNVPALEGVRDLFPRIKRVMHVSYALREDGAIAFKDTGSRNMTELKDRLLEWRDKLGLSGFNLPTRTELTTPAFVNAVKDEGCWVSLWFAHTPAMADRFRDARMDAFVTGAPSVIREHLEKTAPAL